MVSSKKKSLHFDFISGFPIFLPKSGCSLKKKKGLHSESFSEQTSAADSKLYVLFSRGGLRRLTHSPHPISTTENREIKDEIEVKTFFCKDHHDFGRKK